MTVPKEKLNTTVLASVFLALALVLPLLTGQIPQIGRTLCPMHIPVLLCGFVCGPVYGLLVGLIAPLMRFAIFGMPQLIPTGIAMSCELATYGVVAGLLYKRLPAKKISIYISLIPAMIAGRVVSGLIMLTECSIMNVEYGWSAFITAVYFNSIPGIIIHIIIIPIIVIALQRSAIPNNT